LEREVSTMPKTSALFAAAALAALLGGANLAHAQNPPAPQGTTPHSTPMQGGGGMCGGGPGGMCGTNQPAGQPAQGAPMQGMMQQGQGGTMQGGCAMMQRAASLERRLRQLEERMGISAPAPPPAEHHHQHQHGAPG
jgi:hypothetical protein